MIYNLFLDDERKPGQVSWVSLPLVQWTTVRNYRDFVDTISAQGLPGHVSFDHDLCDEHHERRLSPNGQSGRRASEPFNTESGFQCTEWLVGYCHTNQLDFPSFTVHSLNRQGTQNIRELIHAFVDSRLRS